MHRTSENMHYQKCILNYYASNFSINDTNSQNKIYQEKKKQICALNW